jgi:hypothetical protein
VIDRLSAITKGTANVEVQKWAVNVNVM